MTYRCFSDIMLRSVELLSSSHTCSIMPQQWSSDPQTSSSNKGQRIPESLPIYTWSHTSIYTSLISRSCSDESEVAHLPCNRWGFSQITLELSLPCLVEDSGCERFRSFHWRRISDKMARRISLQELRMKNLQFKQLVLLTNMDGCLEWCGWGNCPNLRYI